MRNQKLTRNPKIVVIGAGIAGLTTAYRLWQQNFAVEVYEARARSGGRVFSATAAGQTIELGAQNILDGGEAKSIRQLMNELKISSQSGEAHSHFSYFDGERLHPYKSIYQSQKIADVDLQEKLTMLAKHARNMQDVLDALIPKTSVLHKIYSLRLATYEGAEIDKLSPIYIETLYHMLKGGSSTAHQNETIEMLAIKDGNSQLPEALTKCLSGRVHLNMPLYKISKNAQDSYCLDFKNGQQITADIVVLAMPCSVYTDIEFADSIIPKKRLSQIRNVRYGENAKIMVPLIKRSQKRDRVLNDRCVTLFNHDYHIINIYYAGVASQFNEDNIQNTYERELIMLKKVYNDVAIPEFAETAEDKANMSYENAVGYSWPNDPYVKGSYSYIAPGQETYFTARADYHGETVKSLFRPIAETLFFAGEHASTYVEAPGTMEAACHSGESTARLIIKHYLKN